jgi:hypothetical protein
MDKVIIDDRVYFGLAEFNMNHLKDTKIEASQWSAIVVQIVVVLVCFHCWV